MSRTISISFYTAATLLFLTACGSNESVLKSGKETPSSNIQSPKSSIDQELEAMRTADFRFVYVIRRKDGGIIDAEDKGVIRVNTQDSNRRVSADDEKAFIIGTNNVIPSNNMMALYLRFAIEDHSPQPPPNTNANPNK